jgi:hypothetical protein
MCADMRRFGSFSPEVPETADRLDDGDARFEGGDHPPVVDQALAAVLRVTTILGAKP